MALTVDFLFAAFGGDRVVDVLRNSRCQPCAGTGSKPGTAPQLCHACGGTGQLRANQGFFQVSKQCGYCDGRGKILTHPCETCSGSGNLSRRAQLKVRIPAGSEDGTVLRFAGEGEPSLQGGDAGDLLITLQVNPHPLFEREGAHVSYEVPISFVDAAVGGHVDVPTLDGKVRMKIPPGTQTGRIFRLRGKGVPGADGHRGDLHISVRVEVPVELTSKERRLVEALRKLDERCHPEQLAFWQRAERSGR